MSQTLLSHTPILLKRHWMYLGRLGYSRQTLMTYRCQMGHFLRYLEDHESVTDLKDIDKNLLLRYQSHLSTANLALQTQSQKVTALKSFFKFLEEHDLILQDPSRTVRLPKLPKHLPSDIFTQEEIKKLLDSIPTKSATDLRDKALLETLYSTAIRSSEASGLSILDVNEARFEIRIRHGKGNKERRLPLGDKAAFWIGEYLKNSRPKLLSQHQPTDALWLTFLKTPLQSFWIPVIVAKYAKQIGIRRYVNAHMIRHSTATHMLERGASLRHVQELLGHRDITATQRYARVVISELKAVHQKTHPRELD